MKSDKMPCACKNCDGEYFIQVDPVGCGCTECIIGEYRPAKDEADYEWHKKMEEIGNSPYACICTQVSWDNEFCKVHLKIIK